ncbi:MAG: hypothetical protein JO291_15550 [Acidimicrobiia bacterium]|nr:hypothetical protein [Acidimicrobiia bacterium]
MPVVTTAPADLSVTALGGEPRTLEEWVTTFHLLLVVIDPYTDQSAWILETAARVLGNFREADCRVAWLVASDADDARTFLGPYGDRTLTLIDPDRAVIRGLGLEWLPALVHIRQDLTVVGAAEGWHPAEWASIAENLGRIMRWSRPLIPGSLDPSPFDGSPV